MLLAVAQQEDEVPTVRREAIAALVAVLEDDKRKIEVASLSVYSIVPSAVLTASIPPSRKAASGKKTHEGATYMAVASSLKSAKCLSVP